jgi:Trk K+ transport system NAD-binding subunit
VPLPEQEDGVAGAGEAPGKLDRLAAVELDLHAVTAGGAATRPGGSLELEAGDRVLLLADADELGALARLFTGSQALDR